MTAKVHILTSDLPLIPDGVDLVANCGVTVPKAVKIAYADTLLAEATGVIINGLSRKCAKCDRRPGRYEFAIMAGQDALLEHVA